MSGAQGSQVLLPTGRKSLEIGAGSGRFAGL
jgi:hypothetical protein